ncbi:MAG TPA: hypothetical protein VNT99_18260 [Methylomirabilota bacterium]|nr:hypothetical protein [Methylomirabilota bacterium]
MQIAANVSRNGAFASRPTGKQLEQIKRLNRADITSGRQGALLFVTASKNAYGVKKR